MSGFDTYKTPLDSRYSSPEMKALFGARSRHSVWRKLWYWLAQSEKEVGLEGISDEALAQMAEHLTVTDEDFAVAAIEEKRRRHDVMAHVHAFGEVAPAAAPIIHLGATSCFVTDNAELILMRDAMDLLLPKLAKVIRNFSQFALHTKDIPTLGWTHYQPAQIITTGRRAAQWVQDLMMDLKNIEIQRQGLLFRGAMGTTGTQASFLEIFQGDGAKIDKLNELLCQKAGFPKTYDISVQTYSRKVDLDIANAICGLGTTAMHITSDIRHLANMKELEEPFEKDQIGSSAMAYKRNPMRSERICSLGRKLRSLPVNFADTYADQWFERSLDDSAIRRIDIPEMMLLADAILIGLDNVSSGLVTYPKRIHAHVMEELPFMATENIIMKMVAKGGSRQEAHEQIRVLSHQASDVVKNQGGKNDLIERIKATEYFKPVWDEIDGLLDPKLFVGRSVEMVERYCGAGGPVEEKLKPYAEYITKAGTAQLNV
ncbi:adenylosuccinate lyase [Sodiomyces alkalinus F11]|uniref:Adenylosuccinate lyase n=1 Tax=Sodiomyces alkalinus (strain CBS 110278 / VKM F-3762 / F11) TaxID=1314773 RepID=A0A3N2Q116_SODAK|nr:adenylosuccinate lyase [Sodiomyces alkalinus F11]ROT40422.1 adenylosuccinate lyase [Sodiomyces alkalinus F11]